VIIPEVNLVPEDVLGDGPEEYENVSYCRDGEIETLAVRLAVGDQLELSALS
jgi:hypothetical protein